MQRFVGIGECMVELSAAGDGLWRQSYAGDVFNTLWYARATLPAHWEVVLRTGLGSDPISAQMQTFIEGAGVRCDAAQVPDRRPGLYMIHTDKGERSFTYWRETSAARLLAQDRDAVARALKGAEVGYFSGITLAILPPGDVEPFLAVLRHARAHNTTIAFDPNIRPALWPDADRMARTIEAGAAVADIVLPGFSDERAVFGDADPGATASRYRALGAELVVVKNGGDDLLIDWKGTRETLEFPTVASPVDTTGAGDAFNGAFLGCYAETLNPGQAALAGHDCAVKVIGHPGALVPTGQDRANG